jgi:hypothetical protein
VQTILFYVFAKVFIATGLYSSSNAHAPARRAICHIADIVGGMSLSVPPKLGFPWIPLVESGLFNGLQEKKIKKIPRPLTRVAGCGQTPETQIFLSFSTRRPAFRKHAEGQTPRVKRYSTSSVFRKAFARTFLWRRRLRSTHCGYSSRRRTARYRHGRA